MSHVKKTVAIVGAGPAGIVTARKILQCGQFTTTIFEKGDTIGGSWVPGGIINPNMRTNQSKFTMGFSDLSWDCLGHVSVYPKASDVYRYLEEYSKRYIPADVVHLHTTFTQVVQTSSGSDAGCGNRWKLHLHEAIPGDTAKDFVTTFDYVVVAPGFYNVPKLPKSESLSAPSIPVLHSTEYRGLDDISRGLEFLRDVDQSVLVVGGSHSGGEIAALIAMQLSNAKYSPDPSISTPSRRNRIKVVHVSSHEMSALPAFIKDSNSPSCSFQPIDFTLFNRSSRPHDPPPTFTVGLVKPEKITTSRKLLRTILDGYEGSIDCGQLDTLPPIGILGDNYSQFIKTGRIAQVRGVLTHLKTAEEEPQVTATIEQVGQGESTYVSNVCAVIFATGFDTPSSLAFLSSRIKADLDYDPACSPAPFILNANFLSQNISVPSLAVVGFPGAYWPLFEMQARAIVNNWTSSSQSRCISMNTSSGQRSQLYEFFQELRNAVKEGRKEEIPHNPFGDAVGALEQASRELDLDRFDLGFSEVEGFVCSARYIDPGGDKTEAMKTLMEIQTVQKMGKQGGFLARAVMRGLLGDWIAAGKDTDGKTNITQLSFFPRYPTDLTFDWEYLVLKTDNSGTTRNVYRYAEATDCITVWNVAEDGLSTSTLENMFHFKHPQQEHGRDTAVAVLVAPSDTGKAVNGLTVFRFHFSGSLLLTWATGIAGQSLIPDLNFIRVGIV